MSSLVIAIFLLSIGASFVQRTTGFGFGIFIMTMLPFFLPTYGEATTLSGLLAITTSAVIDDCFEHGEDLIACAMASVELGFGIFGFQPLSQSRQLFFRLQTVE